MVGRWNFGGGAPQVKGSLSAQEFEHLVLAQAKKLWQDGKTKDSTSGYWKVKNATGRIPTEGEQNEAAYFIWLSRTGGKQEADDLNNYYEAERRLLNEYGLKERPK